jgi:DME family drug/metabolite transporter
VLPALAVIVAALCFATTSPSFVFADVDGSAVSVGAARLLLGGAILGAIAWRQWVRTPPPPRQAGSGLDRIPSWVFVVAGALGMFAFQPTYFGGAAMNGVAIGTVVAIGSAPIITGVLDAIIRRRIPTLRWGVATIVALIGVVLVSGVVGSGAAGMDVGGTGVVTVSPLGILTSVGAGASYAVYAIATKILLDRGWRVGIAAGSVFGVTAILSLPVVILTPTDWLFTPAGALLVVWLALVATVLAYLLLGWGLERLNPTTVTTLTLGEPLGATLLGVIVLREQLPPVSIVGLVIIAIGLTILTVPARRRRIRVSAAVITDAEGTADAAPR